MMKTRMFLVRWAVAGGLCLALGACGGDDSGSEPSNNGSENEDNDDDNDFDSNQTHSNQNSNQNSNQQSSSQESECSNSSECEFVVCDCFDGPVNFQACRVVNGVGICATESTCDSDFNACE